MTDKMVQFSEKRLAEMKQRIVRLRSLVRDAEPVMERKWQTCKLWPDMTTETKATYIWLRNARAELGITESAS